MNRQHEFGDEVIWIWGKCRFVMREPQNSRSEMYGDLEPMKISHKLERSERNQVSQKRITLRMRSTLLQLNIIWMQYRDKISFFEGNRPGMPHWLCYHWRKSSTLKQKFYVLGMLLWRKTQSFSHLFSQNHVWLTSAMWRHCIYLAKT